MNTKLIKEKENSNIKRDETLINNNRDKINDSKFNINKPKKDDSRGRKSNVNIFHSSNVRENKDSYITIIK